MPLRYWKKVTVQSKEDDIGRDMQEPLPKLKHFLKSQQ